MTYVSGNIAWYVGKFILGFSGLFFLYAGFIKERKLECICPVLRRDYLRRKGENYDNLLPDDRTGVPVVNRSKDQNLRNAAAVIPQRHGKIPMKTCILKEIRKKDPRWVRDVDVDPDEQKTKCDKTKKYVNICSNRLDNSSLVKSHEVSKNKQEEDNSNSSKSSEDEATDAIEINKKMENFRELGYKSPTSRHIRSILNNEELENDYFETWQYLERCPKSDYRSHSKDKYAHKKSKRADKSKVHQVRKGDVFDDRRTQWPIRNSRDRHQQEEIFDELSERQTLEEEEDEFFDSLYDDCSSCKLKKHEVARKDRKNTFCDDESAIDYDYLMTKYRNYEKKYRRNIRNDRKYGNCDYKRGIDYNRKTFDKKRKKRYSMPKYSASESNTCSEAKRFPLTTNSKFYRHKSFETMNQHTSISNQDIKAYINRRR